MIQPREYEFALKMLADHLQRIHRQQVSVSEMKRVSGTHHFDKQLLYLKHCISCITDMEAALTRSFTARKNQEKLLKYELVNDTSKDA